MTDIAYREKILFFSIGFGQFDFVVVLTPGISKVFLCFAIKLLKLMIKSNFKVWVINKKPFLHCYFTTSKLGHFISVFINSLSICKFTISNVS